MFGLGKHGPDGRYGAVVDIGSGSVGVAIVASDPLEEQPIIVWSHRERMAVNAAGDVHEAEKRITTTILNTILELGSAGLRALTEHDSSAKIETVQVALSAPWSYTVSKTISVNNENPFEVTKAFVEELVEKGTAEAKKVLDTDEIAAKLDLETISDATIDIKANGYRVTNPYATEVRKISLTQLTGVAQKRLLDSVREGKEKVVPGATFVSNTFMYTYYLALHNLKPDTSEICLVDITGEATELGIVRDGVLQYTTHVAYGSSSIARDISGLCGVSTEEAFGFMRENNSDLRETLSDEKKAELEVIIESYETKIAELFHRTGDMLAIPKTIFIHTDALTEAFFSKSITHAAKKTTNLAHAVHPITSKFFTVATNTDSALLLSAYVFHKKLHETAYIRA